MAGTFNSKTGYLSVTGINVSDMIVVNGNVFDSEMIQRMITSSIDDMNLDSEVVRTIANTVRLNDLIDSDAIKTIASKVLADNNIDSEIINTIAVAAQSKLTVNITNLDSDVSYNQMRLVAHDSDIQNVKAKYAVIVANDAVQNTNITTNTADILSVSTRVTQNDSDIAEIETDVSAIYGRLTAAENTNTALDTRVDTLDATVGITGSGGHEDRITTLETTIATLQATIAALTINDLTDVDTSGLTPGQVLVWNGTDFVPGAN